MAVVINSSSSLAAVRSLNNSTELLSKASERLSSGLRINTASDDAAALAVSTSLNARTRIATQGIRNVNDAVSSISIAQGAVKALTDISIRQRELAEESANGTLSDKQRQALNKEAGQLTEEYNRIISTTQFNGKALLTSGEELRVQFGVGTSMSFSFNTALGQAGSLVAGDLAVGESYSTGTNNPLGIQLSDVNGDGKLDIISTTSNNEFTVLLNNREGAFSSSGSYSTPPYPTSIAVADLNGDSHPDVIVGTADGFDDTVSVAFNNGDGTYGVSTPLALPVGSYDGFNKIISVDIDNDNDKDILAFNGGSDYISVWKNDGSGSFGTATNYLITTNVNDLEVIDVNGDGLPDLVTGDPSGGKVGVRLNIGGGNFGVAVKYSSVNAYGLTVADLNGDNKPEIIASNPYTSQFSINFNNGDGTYSAPTNYSGYAYFDVAAGDVNGDGKIDLVTQSGVFINPGTGIFGAPIAISGGQYQTLTDLNGDGALDIVSDGNKVLYNDGTGHFGAPETFAVGSSSGRFVIGDIDGDGSPDVVSSIYASKTIQLLTTGVQTSGTVAYADGLDISTQSGSLLAIDNLSARLETLGQFTGTLGASESRLSLILESLYVSRDEIAAAKARIESCDVAQESANLVAASVRQNIGASVLAYANAKPKLALELLSNL